MEGIRIDCRKCMYFYITYERNFPNGCRAFGFKTREMPSNLVIRSTGDACNVYTEKKKKKT